LGEYKAHFMTRSGYRDLNEIPHDPPLLYHLGHDPGERYDVAEQHPEVLSAIVKFVTEHRASVEPVENQLERREEGALTNPAHIEGEPARPE
jgi:hypothetical protein